MLLFMLIYDLFSAGSGIEKPIGEAVLQIDMMLGKERKVNVRGESEFKIHKHPMKSRCFN